MKRWGQVRYADHGLRSEAEHLHLSEVIERIDRGCLHANASPSLHEVCYSFFATSGDGHRGTAYRADDVQTFQGGKNQFQWTISAAWTTPPLDTTDEGSWHVLQFFFLFFLFFCFCSFIEKPTAPENGTHHTAAVTDWTEFFLLFVGAGRGPRHTLAHRGPSDRL